MVLIWLPKRYLAKALDSSAMKGEAICSLSCIQMTIVLFIGSLTFRLWKGGWWVDAATAIVLGFLFGWEGVKMVMWARDPEFSGGCCKDCKFVALDNQMELGEQYRDICNCCLEKEECRQSDKCQCSFAQTGGEEPPVITIFTSESQCSYSSFGICRAVAPPSAQVVKCAVHVPSFLDPDQILDLQWSLSLAYLIVQIAPQPRKVAHQRATRAVHPDQESQVVTRAFPSQINHYRMWFLHSPYRILRRRVATPPSKCPRKKLLVVEDVVPDEGSQRVFCCPHFLSFFVEHFLCGSKNASIHTKTSFAGGCHFVTLGRHDHRRCSLPAGLLSLQIPVLPHAMRMVTPFR